MFFIEPYLHNTDPQYRAKTISELFVQTTGVDLPIIEGENNPSYHDYVNGGVYIIQGGCLDLPEGDSGILLVYPGQLKMFLPAGPTGHFWHISGSSTSWGKV